jgi:CheY-like chemotaxis protein
MVSSSCNAHFGTTATVRWRTDLTSSDGYVAHMLTSEGPPPRAELKTNRSLATTMRGPAVKSEARILIVDEDRGVGIALSFMLATRRYDDVRAVRSAARAVAIAKQFRPDIVFLDLELPDSIAVARQLGREDVRQNRPRLIALTNDAEHPMREEARRAGFERFLVKPVSHEELDKILGIYRTAT